MSAYRQLLRMGDYQGDVLWEMVISADYENLYSGECFDVDVIEFESLKREGESRTLEQKDDEFNFKLSEFAIRTEYDTAVAELLRQSEYSDVWVALFAHEIPAYAGMTEFESRNIDNLLFAGMLRQKATAKDLAWIGNQWEDTPNPLREWSYSVQSLGTAVLDTVNMTSKKIDSNTVIEGVLDGIGLSAMTGMLIYHPVFWEGKVCNSDIVPLDFAMMLIINETAARLQSKIQGLVIELCSGETGFNWSMQSIDGTVQGFTGEAVPLFNTESAMMGGFWIDRKLIKPLRTDDGIGVDGRDSVSWHRYNSVTEWLYALAVSFGNQVVITLEGNKKIKIEFRKVISDGLGIVEIIDADAASLDIQSDEISDGDKYSCQATSINNEGWSKNYRDSGGYIKSDTKLDTGSGTSLPVSVSITLQKVGPDSSNLYLPQNCYVGENSGLPPTWNGLSTLPMAWTGLYYGFSSSEIINQSRVLDVVAAVCNPIGDTPIWYSKLSECLNNRISSQSKIYTSDYKITVPYIKGFRNVGGEPSLFALDLFGRVVLDGREFVIVGYEIKPTSGEVDITLSRISRYAFYEPESPSGRINIPIDTGDELYRPTIGGLIASEPIERNDLIMINSDGAVSPYFPLSVNYGRYCGVAIQNYETGANVAMRISGTQWSDTALVPGMPVYARIDGNKCKPNSNRLNTRSESEQIDICIGYAISSNNWILDKKNEFIIE